ncbi:MAG: YIP1 family protein [Clostridia bacterium]|nr:YIP1 family protein [Clostridia bacterium]
MKKIIKVLSICFVLLMLLPVVCSAATPYSTYTYSINGTVLESPDAYVPYGEGAVNSATLGLEQRMDTPSDIESDKYENLYITDKNNDRIIIVDKFYNLKAIIKDFFNADGVEDSFKSPESTFVVDTGAYKGLYVCDTQNHRIAVFDIDTYEFIKVFNWPEIDFDKEDATYDPVSCVVDKYGRIYVTSHGNTNGIIVLTETGEFINFIGAPKVSVAAVDALIQMISGGQKDEKVSTPYSSLELDNTTGDFVYATVVYPANDDNALKSQEGAIRSKNGTFSPVRLLNASGVDIMSRNGFFSPAGEVAVSTDGVVSSINKDAPKGVSTVSDVTSGPNGIWSIIDSKRSKVYTYDRNGNLLYIFGDKGDMFGNIMIAEAITYQGEKIVVLDSQNASFTVYKPTDYANVLTTAIKYQNERDFKSASEAWQEVLAWNNNFDTAYVEMGKASYRLGDPETAITYFQSAFETTNYAEAFKQIRADLMEKIFVWLVIGIVAFVIIIAKIFGWAGKVNKAAATKTGKRSFKEEYLYGFHLMFHPFDGYWDLKHEKRGSVRASIVFIVLTILAFYYQSVGQGYYFNPQGTYSGFFSQASSVLIPLFLWVISNWCFTTLFDGEGSFKDIFIATSYGLFPVPALVVVSTILTNVFVGTEAQITSMIVTIAYLWMVFLIVIGMQVTHDYSMGKNILTVIATLVGMIFLMFMAVLFTTLISKMLGLVTTISSELSFR